MAGGTYTPNRIVNVSASSNPTNRHATFRVSQGIEVYGGFAGTETSFTQTDLDARNFTTNETILSGDVGTIGITTDNTYHVVLIKNAGTTTVLDGLTIENGNADGALPSESRGGGVYNDGSINGTSSSNPQIRNSILRNNNAELGGAIFNNAFRGGASPVITDVTFANNNSNPSCVVKKV